MALQAQVLKEDAENARAWRVYQLLVTGFGLEAHALPSGWARMTSTLDDAEFFDLYQRCSILYDVFHPAPEAKPEE